MIVKSYVHMNESGAYRIVGKRVTLDSVVHGFLQGLSPEAIASHYPALTLEEVYGAIAFYLANREGVDQYLMRQEQLWKELRAKQDASRDPLIERLRALQASQLGKR
jgi:uncharacterized protein (DUF433 family)